MAATVPAPAPPLELVEFEPVRLETPTGLTPAEVGRLDEHDRRLLARWHAVKAGDDDGRPFWPAAIRGLDLNARLQLAKNSLLDRAWTRREQLRVADAAYFVHAYGHVQGAEGEAPEPFLLWPEQRDVLAAMLVELRLIILKARQLGLTWLALHYGFWLVALNPRTPNAKVLALSKHGEDAKKLLSRCRRIARLLPPYLRPGEDRQTRDSLTHFKLEGRGTIVSLSGSPAAARSETATLAILDEFAFVKNRQAAATHTAVHASLGQAGQEFIISSGNGPPETPGDGQAMATLFARAQAGGSDFRPIFLPTSIHPARTDEWREREQARYVEVEDFLAEHPETVDEALVGKGGDKVFTRAGVNRAERLGGQLDAALARRHARLLAGEPLEELSIEWDGDDLAVTGDLPDPVPVPTGEGSEVRGLVLAADWGLHAHVLALWPLEGGGFYVVREFVHEGDDPWETAKPIADFLTDADRPLGVECAIEFFDASMPGLNRAFMRELRALLARPRLKARGVPFGGPSGDGKRSYKALGVAYLRRLFRAAGKRKPTGVAAVSPKAGVLLRQLRGLEFVDDESGRVQKEDDHGPDAFIAGVVSRAVRHIGR